MMGVNANALSPAKLKELRSGDKIAIRFARTQEEVENGASRIIYEQFPKGVATAFSTKWAAMFPSLNKLSLAQMSQPKRTLVTVVGGSAEIVRMILTWMLSCCDGRGIQEWPIYTEKPFSKYFILRETADHLGITMLSKEMSQRMERIASKQIHSEDVRALYIRLPSDHPMLKNIAAHVAELIFNNQLRAFGAYRTLREEIPQFDRDINEVLEPKIQIRREERFQEREARQAEREARFKDREQTKKGQKRSDARRGRGTPPDIDRETLRQYTYTRGSGNNRQSSSSQATNVAPNTAHEIANDLPVQHKTLRCSVARKAQGGRPAYVSLSLADAGVDKDEFTGDAFLPPAPKPKRRGKSSISKNDDNKTEANASSQVKGDDEKEQADDKRETASNSTTTNGRRRVDQDNKALQSAATGNQQSSTKTASTPVNHPPATSTSHDTITTFAPSTSRTPPSTTASSAAGSISDDKPSQSTSVSISTSTSPPSSTLSAPSYSEITPSVFSARLASSGIYADINTNTATTPVVQQNSNQAQSAAASTVNATKAAHAGANLPLRLKPKPKPKARQPASVDRMSKSDDA